MYPTMQSMNECPVCGHKEWYPLTIVTQEPMKSITFCQPVVDSRGYENKDIMFDQCARCGTVVSG